MVCLESGTGDGCYGVMLITPFARISSSFVYGLSGSYYITTQPGEHAPADQLSIMQFSAARTIKRRARLKQERYQAKKVLRA